MYVHSGEHDMLQTNFLVLRSKFEENAKLDRLSDDFRNAHPQFKFHDLDSSMNQFGLTNACRDSFHDKIQRSVDN